MATGWSRVYDVAVLDPLAEQLTDIAGISAGMRVVDALAGSGRLTRRLVGSVGPLGRVTAVEDMETAGELRDELHAARVDADVADAPLTALPYADGSFDAALSLLGITATRGGAGALAEMARIARRVIVLAPRRGVMEDALLAALNAGIDDEPAHLLARWEPPPLPVGWTSHVITDVARFDSVTQLLRAAVEHAGLSLPQDATHAVRAQLTSALAAYAGADGTLRVPLQATVMQSYGVEDERGAPECARISPHG
jgi:SAM-dependent methyltransferase